LDKLEPQEVVRQLSELGTRIHGGIIQTSNTILSEGSTVIPEFDLDWKIAKKYDVDASVVHSLAFYT
jgi:hypothetical protein